jgi:hypothetical protein
MGDISTFEIEKLAFVEKNKIVKKIIQVMLPMLCFSGSL